jgi:hypothetical protein
MIERCALTLMAVAVVQDFNISLRTYLYSRHPSFAITNSSQIKNKLKNSKAMKLSPLLGPFDDSEF